MGSVSVVIGYKYYLGLQFCLCQDSLTEVLAIYSNNAKKTMLDLGSYTDGQTVYINKENLYGGRKKGGGVRGNIQFQFGSATQAANSYLNSKVDMTALGLPVGASIPPMRGLSTVTAEQPYLCSMNPTMRPWEFKVYRNCRQHYTTNPSTDVVIEPEGITAASDGYDVNPISVIEECLFNPDWGLGLPESDVDVASLETAMNLLKTDGVGISMRLADQSSVRAFITELLTHINGVMYVDPSSGRLGLRLMRSSDLSELSIGQNELVSFDSYERISWSSTINELSVTYTDKTNYDRANLVVHSSSNLDLQGEVIAKNVTYKGFRSQALALKSGARDLSMMSYPLCKVMVTLNKAAWGLKVGSRIDLTYLEYDLDGTIFRVVNIDYGDIHNSAIKVHALQDIAIDYASQPQPYGVGTGQLSTAWSEITQTVPSPQDIYKIMSAPYYVIRNALNQADFDNYDLTNDAFMILGSKVYPDTIGVELHRAEYNPASGTLPCVYGGYCAHNIEDQITDYDGPATPPTIEITVYMPVPFPEEVATSIENTLVSGAKPILIIDNEWFLIDSASSINSPITFAAYNNEVYYYITANCYRGALHTTAESHLVGQNMDVVGNAGQVKEAIIIPNLEEFSSTYGGLDGVVYTDGSTEDFRLISVNMNGESPYNSSPLVTVNGISNPDRPYPPKNLRVSHSATDFTVSWQYDDKTVSIASVSHESAFSNAPESTDIRTQVRVRAHDGTYLYDGAVDSLTNSITITAAAEEALTISGNRSPSIYIEAYCFYNSDPTNTSEYTSKIQSFRSGPYLSPVFNDLMDEFTNTASYDQTGYDAALQYRFEMDDHSCVMITSTNGTDATIYVCDENGVVSSTISGGNCIGMLNDTAHVSNQFMDSPLDWITVIGATASTATIAWTSNGTTFNVTAVATVDTTITNTFTLSNLKFNLCDRLKLNSSYIFISDHTQTDSADSTYITGAINRAAHDGTGQVLIQPPSLASGNVDYQIDIANPTENYFGTEFWLTDVDANIVITHNHILLNKGTTTHTAAGAGELYDFENYELVDTTNNLYYEYSLTIATHPTVEDHTGGAVHHGDIITGPAGFTFQFWQNSSGSGGYRYLAYFEYGVYANPRWIQREDVLGGPWTDRRAATEVAPVRGDKTASNYNSFKTGASMYLTSSAIYVVMMGNVSSYIKAGSHRPYYAVATGTLYDDWTDADESIDGATGFTSAIPLMPSYIWDGFRMNTNHGEAYGGPYMGAFMKIATLDGLTESSRWGPDNPTLCKGHYNGETTGWAGYNALEHDSTPEGIHQIHGINAAGTHLLTSTAGGRRYWVAIQ